MGRFKGPAGRPLRTHCLTKQRHSKPKPNHILRMVIHVARQHSPSLGHHRPRTKRTHPHLHPRLGRITNHKPRTRTSTPPARQQTHPLGHARPRRRAGQIITRRTRTNRPRRTHQHNQYISQPARSIDYATKPETKANRPDGFLPRRRRLHRSSSKQTSRRTSNPTNHRRHRRSPLPRANHARPRSPERSSHAMANQPARSHGNPRPTQQPRPLMGSHNNRKAVRSRRTRQTTEHPHPRHPRPTRHHQPTTRRQRHRRVRPKRHLHTNTQRSPPRHLATTKRQIRSPKRNHIISRFCKQRNEPPPRGSGPNHRTSQIATGQSHRAGKEFSPAKTDAINLTANQNPPPEDKSTSGRARSAQGHHDHHRSHRR